MTEKTSGNSSVKIILAVIAAALAAGALLFVWQRSKTIPSLEAAFQFAGQNDQRRLTDLLRKHPQLVNQPNKHGFSLLHDAARRADVDIAQLLIEKGADVNAKDRQGKTPLDRADEELGRAKTWKYSSQEAVKMISLLETHGAQRTARTPAGSDNG